MPLTLPKGDRTVNMKQAPICESESGAAASACSCRKSANARRVKTLRLSQRPNGVAYNDRSGDQRASGGLGEAGGISEIEHVELAQASREPLSHTSQGASDALRRLEARVAG